MLHLSHSPHLSPEQSNTFSDDFFSSQGTAVHPSSLIGPNVTLEENVKVGPFCVLSGAIHIGAGTKIYSHTTLGFPAQDSATKESLGSIEIGKNCTIREFVSIHASKYSHGKTKIGNNCYVMNYSHISHDVELEDSVILINNATLAGHARIGRNVMLMAYAAIHQFCNVGEYSCITPFSGTRQDIPPFSMFSGQPAHFAGLNKVALRRAHFPIESINALKYVTHLFYQKKLLMEQIKEILQKDTSIHEDPYVKKFISFIENSKRGVSRRTLSYNETSSHREGE